MANDQEILNYIKAQQKVSIPELQKRFSADYRSISKLIEKCVEDGVLRLDSGIQYFVLQTDRKREAGRFDELYDLRSRRASLEARRREILRRMREECEKETLEDDEESDDDESDDKESGDDTPPEVYAITHELDEGVSIIQINGEHYLAPEGLNIRGRTIRFKIVIRDDDVYLSDDAIALRFLKMHTPLDAEGISERIHSIADRYQISIVEDELWIEVPSPENTVTYMLQLFAAIERIVAIDADEVAMCVDTGKENESILGVAKELLTADPEMDRGQLILRMRERYQRVKDGENIDDIVVYARAVKEFAKMTEADYAKIRDTLLARESGQAVGVEKEEKEAFDEEDVDDELFDKRILSDEVTRTADIITGTLAGFHIDSGIANVSVGATVMRFALVIPSAVSPSAVTKRATELAMRLGQREGVRVYTDPAGSRRICIEVPRVRSERETVPAEELIHDANERWSKPESLYFAIGKDVDGNSVYGDIVRLKNILIGGTIGSGKSTFLHTMIYNLVTKYSPDDVRLILCDSKQSEFMHYDEMPHLLTGHIITDAEPMARMLTWAIHEMERRYQIFQGKIAAGDPIRNIEDYHAARKEGEENLPRIVIIIDEYADFVAVNRAIGEGVLRLAQKARAAGIHLVLATQRPTPDVVTGALKSNFPTRIAFRVIRENDSRILINESGAEKLLGFGDLLMWSEFTSLCERIQGAYLPYEALAAAVAATKKTHEAKFNEGAKQYIRRATKKTASNASDKDTDASPESPLYIKALAIVIQEGEASISLVYWIQPCGENHRLDGKHGIHLSAR